jgi:deazaflavin-dependent oxidoreductase (nitroreductase family)
MSDFNAKVIEEFRSNHGQVGGNFEGAPMVVLTTTGAKTGSPRTHPLVYLRDGDRVVIFASKAGAPTHPDWYRNLRANPRVTVEVGDETYEAEASLAEGEERERLFSAQVAVMPGFADYQKMTTRVLPVVILTRV